MQVSVPNEALSTSGFPLNSKIVKKTPVFASWFHLTKTTKSPASWPCGFAGLGMDGEIAFSDIMTRLKNGDNA